MTTVGAAGSAGAAFNVSGVQGNQPNLSDGIPITAADAVVWVGMNDPGASRRELAEKSDTDSNVLQALIAGWQQIEKDRIERGATVAQALKMMDGSPDRYETLRAVLAENTRSKPGQLPSSQAVGYLLRKFSRRVSGGLYFDQFEDRTHTKVWFVADTAVNPIGSIIDPETAGDAGNAGDVSAPLTHEKIEEMF